PSARSPRRARRALLQREAFEAAGSRPETAPALGFAAGFAPEHLGAVPRPHRSDAVPAAGQLAAVPQRTQTGGPCHSRRLTPENIRRVGLRLVSQGSRQASARRN